MILRDLHIALANSLGDPVVYNATGSTKDDQLTGNVRYSAASRESYLYRAMSKIVSDAFSVIGDRTLGMQHRILQTWFPTSTKMIMDKTGDAQGLNFVIMVPDLLFPYSLAIRFPGFAGPGEGHLYGPEADTFGHILGGVNVTIMTSSDAYNRTTSRGLTDKSAYAYVAGYNQFSIGRKATYLHVMASQYLTPLVQRFKGTHWWNEKEWMQYEFTYLPQIPILTGKSLDDAIEFEEMYYGDIVKYATLYGLIDSQEIEPVKGAAEVLYAKHFTLLPPGV